MPKQKKGEDYLEIQRIYFDEAYQGGGEVKIHRLGCQKQRNIIKLRFGLVYGSTTHKHFDFMKKEGLSLQVHMNFILVMS